LHQLRAAIAPDGVFVELNEAVYEVVASFLSDFYGLNAFLVHLVEDLDEVLAGHFEGEEDGAAVVEVVWRILICTAGWLSNIISCCHPNSNHGDIGEEEVEEAAVGGSLGSIPSYCCPNSGHGGSKAEAVAEVEAPGTHALEDGIHACSNPSIGPVGNLGAIVFLGVVGVANALAEDGISSYDHPIVGPEGIWEANVLAEEEDTSASEAADDALHRELQ
jgi:hypothetical protein